jgi:putative transposase
MGKERVKNPVHPTQKPIKVLSKRYPEAVRSLAEDEENLFTFSQFPAPCTDTFRPPMPLKASGASCASGLFRSTSCTLETSCLSIIWATIQDIRLHKLSLE